jgi:hypothetical protein
VKQVVWSHPHGRFFVIVHTAGAISVYSDGCNGNTRLLWALSRIRGLDSDMTLRQVREVAEQSVKNCYGSAIESRAAKLKQALIFHT